MAWSRKSTSRRGTWSLMWTSTLGAGGEDPSAFVTDATREVHHCSHSGACLQDALYWAPHERWHAIFSWHSLRSWVYWAAEISPKQQELVLLGLLIAPCSHAGNRNF